MNTWLLWACVGACCVVVGNANGQEQPWRLDQAFSTPDWLTISGSHRIRYETISNQFRPAFSGEDEVLSLRTLFKVEIKRNDFSLVSELEDSRAYLNNDDNSVVGTSIVNTTELLQAYVGYRFSGTLSEGDALALRGGRMTIDLGSRRLVPRNRFRNTIQNYTGVWSRWQDQSEHAFTAFYVLPVLIEPSDRAALLDNNGNFDEEDFDLRLWALHYQWQTQWWDSQVEIYLVGLNENDDPQERQTRNRELYSPGLRWYLAPRKGAWDFEWESILQFGERRATTAIDDRVDLDVFAYFHHVSAGYTFDTAWQPRFNLEYDFASGDPGKNGEYHRFDTLFGPRRAEFGPTSIYGLLGRENLNAIGLRLAARPSASMDFFVAWRASFTDEITDPFSRSGLRGSASETSHFAGHQFDARVRQWLIPGSIRFETGATVFLRGELLKNAVNANGEGDPLYFYSGLEFFF